MPAHAAVGDEAFFQYGHYKESERNLFGEKSRFAPIEADNLHGGANVTLADRWKFAFNYIQDTWSGATPISTMPLAFEGNQESVSGASPIINGTLLLNSRFKPSRLVEQGDDLVLVEESRLVHTLSSASPETRKQGDFKLGYEWDEAAVNVGGGVSLEPDYESRFVNLGGRWDLNQKRTTLNLGLSYTASDTAAKLNPDASNYFDYSAYDKQIDVTRSPSGITRTLRGGRQDWGVQLGLSQVLTKKSLVSTSLGYTRSTGFLENPYKVVQFVFVDPEQEPGPDFGELYGDVQAVLEQRPDARNQWTWDVRYVHYVEPLDAALHLGYRFYRDDWDINAHTFEVEWGQPLGGGWTVTPRARYYSQDQADFYRPFFFFLQATPDDARALPVSRFSSDHRLSGFGTVSGGVTVSKKIGKAISLDAGFEYYSHAGDLKLGGDGEGSFADFDAFLFSAALRVDLSAPLLFGGYHHGHGGHGSHVGTPAPAGVMFGHMLNQPGAFMAGYRYMWNLQDGAMLHRSNSVSDAEVVANGCGDIECGFTHEEMTMHMHMLDLMYAPTDWLNLMLMPQFMDMDMTLRALEGGAAGSEHAHGGADPRHATGGVGDTGMYALFKLFDVPGHHLHVGLGVSAPTGSVKQKVHVQSHDADDNAVSSHQFLHYGMQLGSGAWDFRPSLTYTGQWEQWSWGAQLSGVRRLEDRNESGYALGDVFQSTAWGGYGLSDWLSLSVRGVYTVQGAIRGQFNGPHGTSGPMDFPDNHGGRYWDLGVGLSGEVPSGAFQGNRLAVEWLQPLEDDVNGYQLQRDGALSATWSLAF